MAYEMTKQQRADLKALAEKVENAYSEFHDAVTAIGPSEDWDGSCLACPKEEGGVICSSFLGDASTGGRCKREDCGHSFLSHVGGAGGTT